MKIEQLTIEDIKHFEVALKEIVENFNLEDGYLFKYILEDIEGLLYLNLESLIVSFYYYTKNNQLKNIIGYLDENFNFENFYWQNINLLKEGNTWLFIKPDGILQTINYFPISEGYEFNGQVVFAQHNPFNNMLISMYFNHMYQDENSKISTFALHNPWKIILARTKFPKYEKNYILKEINCYNNPLNYSTLVLRKYGIEHYKNKDLPETITNYYRIFFPFNGNTGFNLFPFTQALEEKEMVDMIKYYGFDFQVNLDLVKVYNGDFTLLNDYQKLLFQLQNSLKNQENKGIKLVLKNE